MNTPTFIETLFERRMNRTLKLDIDRTTWPGPGVLPRFPRAFAGQSSYDLNIPAMLLMIGYLTTPTSSTGVSLSEFWAWVRYLAAISPDSTLSLTQSFAELDAHQKTILSDDFGMGVPLLWLSEKLALEQIVDGRYFMQKVAASIGATQRKTAKRGPNKTPDFVARDTTGRWHVIECKGTQSGSVYSERQLSGGVAQKCSITFPAGHTGQRLVCGLSIDVHGGAGSVLRIIDPTPDEPFEVSNHHLMFADDAVNRGVMSRALRMAGFEVTAEAVASPLGPVPDARYSKTARAESIRKRFIAEREQRSKSELGDNTQISNVFGNEFRGREIIIELPRGIQVNGNLVKKVLIKQGVNREALEELQERPTVEDLADKAHVSWASLLGRSVVESDGPSATMRIGNVFRSELILVER
jgi:hypothetical protein